jgi:8-oxo-dGTP diphosphatase
MIQRGDVPGLRWPNLWDFPGGGREGEETPEGCVLREIEEELGLRLAPEVLIWKREWPAMHDASLRAWFFVAKVTEAELAKVVFGDEGKGWQLVPVAEFMDRDDVVPLLKERLQGYLEGQSPTA